MKPHIMLIGLGRFGRNHLRVLRELQTEGSCELCAVVDSDTTVLKDLKDDVKTSTDYRDLLDSVDAVDLVTPTSTHYSIAKDCLITGKDVFVEKPLTTSSKLCQELVNLANEEKKILMAGHIFRYNKAIQMVKELLSNGSVGKVHFLSGHFTGITNPRQDLGVIFNYAVHHIDSYDYLLNLLPTNVKCSVGYFLGRQKLEDIALIILNYPLNVLGIIEVSWMIPEKVRDLTIVGSEMSITSDLLYQTLDVHQARIIRSGSNLVADNQGSKRIQLNFEEPLRVELLDYLNSVVTRKQPLVNGQVALRVIKIAEKAIDSARSNEWVKINHEA